MKETTMILLFFDKDQNIILRNQSHIGEPYGKKRTCFLLGYATLLMFRSVSGTYALTEIGNNGVDVTLLFQENTMKAVRNADYLIKDVGRFNNPYDTVDFGTLYNNQHDLSMLSAQGYRTVVIEATLEMKEICYGYQYIYMYDNFSATSFLAGGQIDYGHNLLMNHYSSFTYYFEVSTFNIKNNDFVLRYDATGGLQDDWTNRNVRIQIGLSKELVKTSKVWQLSWIDNSHTQYTYQALPDAR